MKNKKNKIAGFWVRFLARGLDLILIYSTLLFIGYLGLNLTNTEKIFKTSWYFYFWGVFSICLLFFYFVVVPLLTQGRTIGYWVCRIKIQFKKNKLKKILKREMFFSLSFILNIIIVLLIINHTLIGKFLKANQNKIEYTTIENFRKSIVLSISSISLFVQMVVGVSIIVNKGKGIHDNFSRSYVVYINKFQRKIETDNIFINKKYGPKIVDNKKINWVGKNE